MKSKSALSLLVVGKSLECWSLQSVDSSGHFREQERRNNEISVRNLSSVLLMNSHYFNYWGKAEGVLQKLYFQCLKNTEDPFKTFNDPPGRDEGAKQVHFMFPERMCSNPHWMSGTVISCWELNIKIHLQTALNITDTHSCSSLHYFHENLFLSITVLQMFFNLLILSSFLYSQYCKTVIVPVILYYLDM